MIDTELRPIQRPTHRKFFVVAATLLGVIAAGVAILSARDHDQARLALVSGGEADSQSERLAAPAAGGEVASLPYAYSGIEYRLEGPLPDLGSEAAAWELGGHDLHRAAAVRMSEALGLQGEPILRGDHWSLEETGGTFSASFDGEMWSLNFNRTPAGAATGSPAMTGTGAEGVARKVLGQMGVLDGEWQAQTTESQFGVSVGCAVPAFVEAPAEQTTVESCLPVEQASVSNDFAVSFFPILDEVRADWSAINALVRTDGQIESLYGSWAAYERAGEFKLRAVDAALAELRSVGDSRPQPMIAEPAIDSARPAMAPCRVDVPTSDQEAPMPEQWCGPPQVVTITDVEHSLIPMGVYADGRTRLHLVPAYRFIGTFDGGEAYETSMLALHPDAIAPPPADPGVETKPVPGGTDGGGSSGSGGSEPGYPGPRDTGDPATEPVRR